MTFFYDLNKKMADLANKQQLTEDAKAAPVKTASSPLRSQLNERDLGKHNNATTGFAALAKKTNPKIAGAQLAKMRDKGQVEEGSKPDFLDLDKDGNRKEPMRSAARSAKKSNGDMDESRGMMREQSATPYQILGLNPGAKSDAIKQAYRNLSSQHHPDKGGNAAKFQQITGAYRSLINSGNVIRENHMCSACGCNPCKCDSMEESALQAAFGKKKYGDQGMKALQKAGRNHAGAATMNKIRNQYDKYDESMTDEGNAFSGAVVKAKANGIQPGEKINVGGKQYPLRQEGVMDAVKAVGSVIAPNIKKAVGAGAALGAVGESESSKGGKQYPVKEAAAPLDYDKVLEAIAALYGDDMWDNDAMGDLANDLEQAGPTDRELDFIITKGKLPKRLKNIRFTNTDDVQFGHLDEKGGIPMTPKQKSFAKLAPPVDKTTSADKITFADKIVYAKEEVDEMLGDVAADAMRKALGNKGQSSHQRGQQQDDEFASNHFAKARNQRRLDAEDEFARSKGRNPNADMEEGFMDDEPYSRKSSTGGRIDTTRAGVTRHHAGKSYSGADHSAEERRAQARADADDERGPRVGRRTVGAGMGTKIGAKINRGTSKLMTREGNMDPSEYDQEGEMAKDDIKTVVRHAQALEKILGDNDNLPEWVQAKLAKIEGMMTAVDDYMQNQQHDDMGSDDMEMDEESTNKRDDRAEKAGKKVTKDIEYDEKKKDGIHGKRRDSEDNRAERAGKKVAKDIEYDEKKSKKKKEVDETTTSGSVSTNGAAPKSGGGMIGKGIYDSMNREVEKMISESMSMNMSMNNEGHGGPTQSLTVTATDEDAIQLAMLLKSAGLGSQEHNDMSAIHNMDNGMSAIHDMDHGHGDEPCPACGSSECECDSVDEAYGDTDATNNEPDYPTDEVGTDDAMMYSGGLDGPKSTGQATVPVIAGQDDRMGYEGDNALRRMMEMAGVDSKDKYEKLNEIGLNLMQPRAGILPGEIPDEYNDKANQNAMWDKYEAYIKKTEQELAKEKADPRGSPAHIKYLQDQIKGLQSEQLHNSMSAHSDDASNALRKQAIANNELTPGQWIQKATQYFKGKITGQPQPGVSYDRIDTSKQLKPGWDTPTPYVPPAPVPVKESNDDTEFSEGIQRMRKIAGLPVAEAAPPVKLATPQHVDEPVSPASAAATPGKKPAVKPVTKSATPQAVPDPSTKIKESLLMQLRNFKY